MSTTPAEIKILTAKFSSQGIRFVSSNLHRNYIPLAHDFGPVDLSIVHRFCLAFSKRLRQGEGQIWVYCFDQTSNRKPTQASCSGHFWSSISAGPLKTQRRRFHPRCLRSRYVPLRTPATSSRGTDWSWWIASRASPRPCSAAGSTSETSTLENIATSSVPSAETLVCRAPSSSQ